MICNICGGVDFVDNKYSIKTRKNVMCQQCGSFERTRLLWMYLQNLKIDQNTKILHLAPEKGIYDNLVGLVSDGNYVTADMNPKIYPYAKGCIKIDLCDMDQYPSMEYDIIIHSHVLEHIPCNIAYSIFHLHRMLKENGTHICIIPFVSGKYDECFQGITDEEKTRRFGQYDHVRRFGKDDIMSHLGKLLNIPSAFDATKDFSEEALREANIPESHWRGFHIGTVLLFKKYDMKFLCR